MAKVMIDFNENSPERTEDINTVVQTTLHDGPSSSETQINQKEISMLIDEIVSTYYSRDIEIERTLTRSFYDLIIVRLNELRQNREKHRLNEANSTAN